MKNISIILLVILFFFGCAKESETVTIVSENDAFEYYQLGDSVATSLVKILGGRLVDAIQNDGVIKAIGVCQKEAYQITDDLTDDIDAVESIKRVSTKYRNPKNVPDKYEMEALEWFDSQHSMEAKPTAFGQKISRKKGDLIRYYKPMYVQNKCLLCHGDDSARMPEVADRIKKLYPNDLAIDYNDGDFRGLIRVEILGEDL